MKMNKSFAVGMVICFVAVIALSGVFLFRRVSDNTEEKDLQKQVAENKEEDDTKEPAKVTQSTTVQNEEDEEEVEVKDEVHGEKQEENVSTTGGNTAGLFFSSSDTLIWPVDGHVLLNYSMDHTVYFSTLDQYKYNPALIISGEVGDEVLAAERGIITDVTETVETGMTVTVEMGNGYEAIYGQLMEVIVSPGEYIEQGDMIGKLAEPTRYYSVEGCNLYFQLLKDGESINPMEYLDV